MLKLSVVSWTDTFPENRPRQPYSRSMNVKKELVLLNASIFILSRSLSGVPAAIEQRIASLLFRLMASLMRRIIGRCDDPRRNLFSFCSETEEMTYFAEQVFPPTAPKSRDEFSASFFHCRPRRRFYPPANKAGRNTGPTKTGERMSSIPKHKKQICSAKSSFTLFLSWLLKTTQLVDKEGNNMARKNASYLDCS